MADKPAGTIDRQNPPFQAKSLTLTEHVKYDKDHLPPALGRLNPKNLATAEALTGMTPGTDATWIKGTKTLLVNVDHIEDIKGAETRNVFEDQTETIHGETKLTYVHGRDVTVGDEDNLSVNGTQEKFVLGQSEETYVGHHEVNVPSEFEWKLWEGGFTAAETKGVVAALAVRGTEVAFKVQDAEFALVKTSAHEFADSWFTQEGEAAGLFDKIGAAMDASPLVNLGLELGPGHLP
jgi:hypothetical protein